MKKLVKVFSLIAIVALVFTCASCTSKKNYVEGKKYSEYNIVDTIKDVMLKDKTFVGFLYFDEENPGESVLYTDVTKVPDDLKDKAVAIYVTENEKLSGDSYSLPKLPTGLSLGANFSGWFVENSDDSMTRITTVEQAQAEGIVHAKYISYGEGGLVVLICMAIVFLMLALLCGIVALFKFIAPKKKQEAQTKNVVLPQLEPTKPFTMEDITDDDMMAAALVATIDYHNEIHEDVRVISIKEIK